MNSLQATWIGQGGFIFEAENFRLVIDPYLSDSVERKTGFHRIPANTMNVEYLIPGMIIATHDHLDHYDPETIRKSMKLYPDCVLAGPASVRSKAQEDGIDERRFHLLNTGETIKAGPFSLTAVRAEHSDPFAVGIIIKYNDTSMYVSGDTEYFPELPDIVTKSLNGHLQIVFICINGKYGNMNWEEAVSIVKSLQPELAIPMHYGMFEENTADPLPFTVECAGAGINSAALECNKQINILGKAKKCSNL